MKLTTKKQAYSLKAFYYHCLQTLQGQYEAARQQLTSSHQEVQTCKAQLHQAQQSLLDLHGKMLEAEQPLQQMVKRAQVAEAALCKSRYGAGPLPCCMSHNTCKHTNLYRANWSFLAGHVVQGASAVPMCCRQGILACHSWHTAPLQELQGSHQRCILCHQNRRVNMNEVLDWTRQLAQQRVACHTILVYQCLAAGRRGRRAGSPAWLCVWSCRVPRRARTCCNPSCRLHIESWSVSVRPCSSSGNRCVLLLQGAVAHDRGLVRTCCSAGCKLRCAKQSASMRPCSSSGQRCALQLQTAVDDLPQCYVKTNHVCKALKCALQL